MNIFAFVINMDINIVLLGTVTGKAVSLFTLDYTALCETHYTVAFFCSATG